MYKMQWCRCIPSPCTSALAQVMEKLDQADVMAGNCACRSNHRFADLRQVAIIGLLKAAERFNPTDDRPVRPYASTDANGEFMHDLRDSGFAIKVPERLGRHSCCREPEPRADRLGARA